MLLAICGSPRKGNTEYLLNIMLGSFNRDKELILLMEKRIKHCDGCLVCDETGKCHISDDVNQILEKLQKADSVLIGTPTYYENVPGLLKDFIDRTNPLFKDLKLKGKKIGFVATGESSMSSIGHALSALQRFADSHEMNIVGSVTVLDKHIKSRAVSDELNKLAKKL